MRIIPKRNTWIASAVFYLVACWIGAVPSSAQPLTTLNYTVSGQVMQVTPAALSVPKGIPGSIGVTIPGEVPSGAFVEATLRGPSFPARRLVGEVNKPLVLPPLNLVGDYSLDGIRLVSASGETLFEGAPSTVPVRVFDEVLVSRVTSRPLTLGEIEEKGIVIDDANFRAVEFEVGFVVDGATIPIKFPVVTPSFKQSTEIIPAAELEARLAQAEEINAALSDAVAMPPGLEVVLPQVQIKGINVQFVDGGDDGDLALKIPPIPALMVIPGNIGFLNQFFSVLIFTENAAPDGSGLSVHSLTAELVLPTGPDRVAGSFESPGDDPLRFARVAGSIRNLVPVRATGPDGKSGTGDDIDRLQPGDTGQGELLVEGLQEGLHVMDLKLAAKLDGLAAGTVNVTGKAAGSILVRNPKFSMAFTHPRTVRSGEPYEAAVTILNTSSTVANLVSVELNANNVSGGLLESDARVELGNIAPGQTATATFRIRSQKTGAISFSNLTTSDDSVIGRFRLKAGVDERGISLSPDTLVLPEFVDHLPPDLVKAAQRMLGQALSSATAGQLPPGVIKVSRTFLRQKALELAEAGQRVRYGESISRVLPDLLLDWQGARDASDGWDQLLRVTDAGQEWREALMLAMRNAVPGPDHAVTQLVSRSRDMAGRGEAWNIAASDRSDISISFKTPEGKTADAARSNVAKSAGYHGSSGEWLTVAEAAGGFTWKTSAATGATQLSLMKINANGTGRELLWRVDNLPAGGIASFDLSGPNNDLQIDDNGDGIVDRTLAASPTDFTELPPQLLVVRQDAELHVGRPSKPCNNIQTTNDLGKTVGIGNYANVVAVLFSKPMTQATANVPSAYTLDNGNAAAFVQMQPSGRIALLTMNAPLGGIVPREMTVAGTVKDVRGNAFVSTARPVESFLLEGVNVKGRVIRADGSFAANVPVTLTYTDKQANLDSCDPWVRRVAQVRTDASGAFAFDFVIGGLSYTISTTDTSGLSDAAVSLILNSAVKGEVDAAKLNELASLPQNQDTLLAVFAAGALPQAIAKAEGLDRAAIEDLVLSDRFASESFYALRFRGRGTVTGQVVLADGQTPVAGAAANLFPDINSRELGRGILTDSGGRFAFYGVPLGPFSLEATAPNGLTRTVSGVLQKGAERADLVVALGATPPVYSDWQGRLTEPDGTSVAGGAVYVAAIDVNGNMSVVGRTVSDESGYWSIRNIPVGTYTALGFSLDGKRGGRRGPLTGVAGAVATANIVLQARATVKGVVQFANGDPVPGAIVGGGQALVTTDSLGRFTLDGVPTGSSSISAGFTGDETSSDPRKHMPRIAGIGLNVQAGDNYAVIRFEALGRIVGQVLDAAGAPVPRVNVAMPFPNGDTPYFLWVKSDENGRYEFPGLRLTGPEGGPHDLSAPAPPVQEAFDGEGAAKNLTTASSEQVAAIIGEAFSAFTGVNDPFLNGEGANFNPKQWGFVKAVTLDFDGETEVADIRYVRSSNISGVVKNGQGVPIGARVRLTGIGPTAVGSPTFVLRAEKNSDPALGMFEFSGDAFVGDWGLQAASPFFPVVLSTAGRTTSLEPNVSGIVLQFPRVQEVNGSLTGLVLYPDGTPAGANVEVGVEVGADDPRILRTDAQGRFTTGASLFSLRGNTGYNVSAFDPLTGGKARDSVYVKAAQDNQITLTLLGRGNADVLVLKADGSPVIGAAVEISGGQYPQDRASGVTNSNGRIVFSNLFQGPYAVGANATIGLTRLAGRAGTSIPLNGTGTATITLAATATVRGTYVESDGVTPVAFANVRLGSFAYAPTDANGRFSFVDVPLGSHVLTAVDPVTGRGGNTPVTLSQVNEVRDVTIIQTPLGTVSGLVLNAEGNGTVSNAEVVLTVDDAFALTRTFKVTSGPDGAYSIAGVPVGSFTLTARQAGENGTVRGNLLTGTTTLTVNVAFAAKGSVLVQVVETNGTTPATNATVRISGVNIGRTLDTNSQGQATFAGLPMGDYTITAISRIPGQTRNHTAAAFVKLSDRGAVVPATLTMRGTGSVQGIVFQGDGTTPASGAEVKLEIRAASADPATTVSGTVVVGLDGSFSFDNLPAGLPVVLSAKMLGLAASETVQSLAAGQSTTRNLMLTASGTIIGRALRADGSTVAAGTEITITFPSRSGLEGVIAQIVDASGRFSISPVPQGTWSLKAVDNAHGGIAFRSGNIAANAETDDVLDIILDEAFPSVTATTPSSTSDGVDINTNLQVTFSEPLKASSVNNTGVFVRLASGGAAIPATMTQPTPDTVLIDPSAPLESSTTYQIVVVDGNLVNAVGTITNRGPRDLVDRPLNSLFSATFTTRDQRPPVLLSFTPENNAEQVDTRAVVRLSFDEPLAPGAVITLSGPGGAVPGTTTLGVNNLVLVFTPTNDLPPNATFTASVSGLADAAGNAIPGQPLSATFKILDTLGPEIAMLRVKNNQPPVAGSTITLQTVLATIEPEATVRFTSDFQPLGVTAPGLLELPFLVPASGSLIIRAIAADRFGNQGPFAELMIDVLSNQPPLVTFTKLSPTTATVGSGETLSMKVEGIDDGGVSDLRAAISGAMVVPLQTSTGAALTLQGLVPANAVPGTRVDVVALAIDNSGASSGEKKQQIEVHDATPPSLTLVSPVENTRLTAGAPLVLALDWADNSGASSLAVTLTGDFAATQTRAVGASPNTQTRESFTFDVSTAPLAGGVVTATVRVTDAAGLFATRARTFRLADTRAPRLSSVHPVHGTTQVPLWSRDFLLAFDEPMDVATLNPGNLVVRDGTGSIVTISLSPEPSFVRLALPDPLTPGSTYSLTIPTALTDEAGNALVDANGTAFPPTGKVMTFTTAAITAVTPAANAKIVPGQTIPVRADFESGLGADEWEFSFNGGAPVRSFSGQASLQLPSGAAVASLQVRAIRVGHSPYSLPPVALDVRSRSADDDGDGYNNGVEADAGTNPFLDDLALDPDNDGRTNEQELIAGTNANKADTDNDGLNDGAEFTAGTNPLDSDTDDDTLLDGVDPFPLLLNRAPVAVADTLAAAGNATRTIVIAADLLVNDTDPDNETRTFVSFTDAAQGTLTKPDVTTLAYTPPQGFSGPDTFTYTIRDPAGLTSTATVTINVGGFELPVAGELVPETNGRALRFDGVDDRIEKSSFAVGSTWTMEAWVKLASVPTTGTRCIAGNFRSDFNSAGIELVNGTFRTIFRNRQTVDSGIVPEAGRWYHVAGSADGTTVRIYVDGELKASAPQGGDASPNTSTFSLGGDVSTAGTTLPGDIDELRVWSRALTNAEVSHRYAHLLGGRESGLALNWRLDDAVSAPGFQNLVDRGPAGHLGGYSPSNSRSPQLVASTAPLSRYEQRVGIPFGGSFADGLFTLQGSDPGHAPLTFTITKLPTNGKLYQVTGLTNPEQGNEITSAPAVVTDLSGRLSYIPTPGVFGRDTATFKVSAGSNDSEEAELVLQVLDPAPPRLVEITPADTSTGRSPWPTITLGWSEDMEPTTFVAEKFALVDAANVAVPFAFTADFRKRVATLRPLSRLNVLATYTVKVASDLRDLSGYLYAKADGSAVPTEGLSFSFTTGSELTKTFGPLKFVPGESRAITITTSAAFGASFFEVLNGDVQVIGSGSGFPSASGSFTFQPDLETNQTLTLKINGPYGSPVESPLGTFVPSPRSGDDDEDGWLNGVEADLGLNPFVADVDSADPDSDGLTNAQERTHGTHPLRDDTDFDGLKDGAEILAGTNPLNTDTDGDSIIDSTDPFPLIPNRAPVTVNDTLVLEPGATSVLFLVSRLTKNDSDADGDALSPPGFESPSHGSLEFISDGLMRYTAGPDFSVSDSFTYTVNDGYLTSNVATVTVQSGTNHRPVAGDPSQQSSRFLAFDDDDHALLPGSLLDGATDTTIEFWLRRPDFDDYSISTILSSRDASDEESLTVQMFSQEFGDGSLLVKWGGVENFFRITQKTRDHHYAIVRDSAAETIRVFVDGESVAKHGPDGVGNSVPSGPIHVAADRLALGRLWEAGGTFATTQLNKALSELKIWRRARSEAEIGNYPLPQALPATGLAGYFRFNEVTGSVLVNDAIAGVDGTIPASPADPARDLSGYVLPGAFASGPEDQPILLTLRGTDIDNDELTITLLGGVSYFQAVPDGSGGFTSGAEITTFPATLPTTNNTARVFVRSDNPGSTQLPYFASDASSDSEVAQALVIFQDVPDEPQAPVAFGLNLFTLGGNPVPASLGQMASDSDSGVSTLRFASLGTPAHGTLIVSPTDPQTLIYTPDQDFAGDDSVTFTVTDGTLESNQAVLSISVTAAQVFRWINPGGGSWNNPSNWDRNALPGGNDVAVIDLPGTYRITVDQPAITSIVRFEAGSGQQTLDVFTHWQVSQRLTTNAQALVRCRVGSAGAYIAGADSTIANLDLSRGQVSGNAHITGNFHWQGGVFSGVLDHSAVVDFGNPIVGPYRFNRLENHAALHVSQGTLQMENGGSFFNASDGELALLSPFSWSVDSGLSSSVTNHGLIKIASGVSMNCLDLGFGFFVNAGRLEVQGSLIVPRSCQSQGDIVLDGGRLAQASDFFQPFIYLEGGTLTGTGTIQAKIFNAAIVRPDPAPGGISVYAFEQTSTGRLELQLGLPDATAGYRSFNVGNSSTSLDGTLAINLLPAFTEPVASVFDIASFGARTGDFATVTGLTQGGYTFSRSYADALLNLTVTTGAPPAPAPQLAASYAEWVGSVTQTWSSTNIPESNAIGGGNQTANAALPASWDYDPNADPDQDGSSNLLEYAFQTNPLDPSSMAGMEVHPDVANPGEIEVRARASRYAKDLEYVLERSLDMVNWTPLRAGDAGILSVSLNSDGPGANLYQVRIGFQQGTRPPGLFRVRVQLRP